MTARITGDPEGKVKKQKMLFFLFYFNAKSDEVYVRKIQNTLSRR
jgi:hypothetical protein